MRKIIIGAVVLGTLGLQGLNADDKKYFIGLDYSRGKVKFSSAHQDAAKVRAIVAKLKFGAILKKNLRIQANLKRENAGGSKIDGIGVDFTKSTDMITAEFLPDFTPYLKFGIGLDTMKIEDVANTRINAVAVSFGLGTYIPINEYFEFEIGCDYQMRTWQDFDTDSGESLSLKDDLYKYTVGVNFLF